MADQPTAPAVTVTVPTHAVPVRGTQTFVGAMSAVWSRPSLLVLEIVWRWLVGAMVIASVVAVVRRAGLDFTAAQHAIANVSAFQPVAGVRTLTAVITTLLEPIAPTLRWLLPVLLAGWCVLAALGRTLVLRRFDGSLHVRPATIAALGLLRAALLAGAWWVWVRLLLWGVAVTITGPAARNEEPSVVLLAAVMICGTLLLYVAWAIFSWFLYFAPLLAMHQGLGPVAAVAQAWRTSSVRSKLIEVNLVMNIEKLALIVLLMVFCASPIPFTNQSTEGFLHLWWALGLLIYFAASDYFHVVRSAAYLRLWAAVRGEPGYTG